MTNPLGLTVDVSLDSFLDVGDLSVSIDGDLASRLCGECSCADGLGAEVKAGGDMAACLGNIIYNSMRCPNTTIEEPTVSLDAHVCFKLVVGHLL